MKFAIVTFPVYDAIPPADLGRAVEDHGFESLFFTEHSHIPASRETPTPWGGELADRYYRSYDPFVALSVIAARTSTLRLGTGICLVPQRDPISLAKEVASLDHISGGRFLFGVGAGWNLEEMRNHGTDPRTRFALLEDRIEAMRAIWTQDEATHHGPFTDFDRIWAWPKPAQRPHPPVLIGGNGGGVIDRVVAHGDEWFPLLGDFGRLREQAAELREKAAAAGRGEIPITVFGGPYHAAAIEQFAELDVHRLLVNTPAADAETVLPHLARVAAQVADLTG
ncbi:LLM class F420-dependent oxidoreductase [Solihabitans fulvus]|uniref:LLM class F420-dependent oxidoreductase n=1 Tax=Solihabitans fulvus TaxID=1892852 RepID=A0A5B2WRY0_9PSEU|nr:LLM class F420-dependent oxidoreductase [Solihabitans fulvus]KAA2253570.1 LLM class F420-dependent oxidoreductase [Solihabitans fulvus]